MSENTQEQTGPVEEKQLNFDPAQVEAELVRIAQERAEDPVETAASTYKIYLPFFEANLKKLSVRGMRRLVNFLVKYPLEQDDIKAANPFEREMMELVNTLVQAKFVMILGTYNEHAEELYEAATTPLTQEQADEIAEQLGLDKTTVAVVESKEGENNG
jgi:superfamily II DNA or RNA helicase